MCASKRDVGDNHRDSVGVPSADDVWADHKANTYRKLVREANERNAAHIRKLTIRQEQYPQIWQRGLVQLAWMLVERQPFDEFRRETLQVARRRLAAENARRRRRSDAT